MTVELALSALNERQLGPLRDALDTGQAGKQSKLAKAAAASGLAIRALKRPPSRTGDHLVSLLYLGAGLAFRFAWVAAGRNSARDDSAVAHTARMKR